MCDIKCTRRVRATRDRYSKYIIANDNPECPTRNVRRTICTRHVSDILDRQLKHSIANDKPEFMTYQNVRHAMYDVAYVRDMCPPFDIDTRNILSRMTNQNLWHSIMSDTQCTTPCMYETCVRHSWSSQSAPRNSVYNYELLISRNRVYLCVGSVHLCCVCATTYRHTLVTVDSISG